MRAGPFVIEGPVVSAIDVETSSSLIVTSVITTRSDRVVLIEERVLQRVLSKPGEETAPPAPRIVPASEWRWAV